MFKLISLFLIATLLGIGFLFVDYQTFLDKKINVSESDTVFSIVSGDNLQNVSKRLYKQNIISKPYYFMILGRLTKKAQLLKAGDYKLSPDMDSLKLLDLFVSGKVITFNIQFIEGWQFSQYLKKLAENPNIKHTLQNIPIDQVMSKIDMPELFYEGLFFPETYQFSNDTKDIDILKQSFELMQTNLAKAWRERDKESTKIITTPYELLIMASLIEKETSIDKERNKVAGVFYRRLSKGMMLQTDPTVIYGMKEKYSGKLYYKDLKVDTPYNTYTRTGLPPTPIAMPSKSSLLAAAHPASGNSLYFVADGKGGHIFSDNYKQHLKLVNSYRNTLKENQKNKDKNESETKLQLNTDNHNDNEEKTQ